MSIYKVIAEYTFSPEAELAKLSSDWNREEGEMEEEVKIPDIYFDGLEVTVTLFGVNLTLTLRDPHPDRSRLVSPKTLIVARTDLKHSKVFAMLLTKQLKKYEETTGDKIFLPDDLYKQLELDPNNW